MPELYSRRTWIYAQLVLFALSTLLSTAKQQQYTSLFQASSFDQKMSSFFQKARDRAQEAAASLQSSSSSSTSHGQGQNAGGGHSTSSGFTYTGSLPHVFRQGLQSFDPRFEATRSLHLMRGALKGVIIDDKALSRETKGVATKTYKWGEDHAREDRLDGVGDEALADVTDRMAFIMSKLGDLELEHAQRLTEARAELKKVQTAELELAPKRAQRVKLVKELQGMVSERQKPGGSAKADQTQAYLSQLEQDAKHEEEELSRLKRRSFQLTMDAQMDSYIQHGEKMALVASYGKLLMQQMPVASGATFPAVKHHKGWEGSGRTAEVRSMVDPALQAYVSRTTVPTLPSESNAGGADKAALGAGAAGPVSSIRDDASSFRTTHAHELAQDNLHGGEGDDASVYTAATTHSALTPLAEDGSTPGAEPAGPNPRWNHSPSMIPALPPRPPSERASLHSPPVPRRPSQSGGTLPPPSPTLGAQDEASPFADQHPDNAPPGPTVAETGAVLPSSPTGPGPKTGTLERRRPSATSQTVGGSGALPPSHHAAAGSPPSLVPGRPPSIGGGSSSGGGGGPVGFSSPASIPPPAAAAATSSDHPMSTMDTGVHARIRRDGTVTRRGDSDFHQAEQEQLPPYTEM